MKSKVLLCVLILTFIVSCCNVVYALEPPPTISGTIFLPSGSVAPAGGISIKVIAQSSTATYTHEGIIEEGKNSVGYVLPILTLGDGYEVRCELTKPVDGYFDVSYYTGENQKPFQYYAERLTKFANYSNINITLAEGSKVTGTLLLPDGLRARNDSEVTVNITAKSDPHIVYDADPMSDTYFSKDVTTVIKKDKTSATFEVILPVYSPGYYFSYTANDYISGVCPASSYVQDRTPILKSAVNVSVVMDSGNVINGKISLPDGEVAGTGGCPVTVSALYYTSHLTEEGPRDYENYINNKVVIPEGENSIDYEITVYPKYDEYCVLYTLEENGIINKGYFSSGATVLKLNRDTCTIEVSAEINNIDLKILPAGEKLYGDINGDGNINSIDLAKLRGYILGFYSVSEIKAGNSDLNLDGMINSLDFALLRRYLLVMVNTLPVV